MRWSEFLLPTLKETPAEAETASHTLMLRAGLVRKVASGVYEWLPAGLRVLRKVEGIIREEMNAIGGQEVLLPAIHPLSLWQKSGRWNLFQPVMFQLSGEENDAGLVLGATHEVIITDLIRREVKSSRQLPLLLYQIQTKFRRELRPRFGVVRTRELLMMDAYSFHKDKKSLKETYQKVKDAHSRIFERCGLDFSVVEADSGPFGGEVSHEYMVPSEAGEDYILSCSCGYLANLEKAECRPPKGSPKEKPLAMKEVATPGKKTVDEVIRLLKVGPERLIKTLLYETSSGPVACLIRGDDELSESKLKAHLKSDKVLMAAELVIEEITGGPLGFSGPVGLSGVKLIADLAIKNMRNSVTGANKNDAHLTGVNITRDFKVDEFMDLRKVKEGEPCPGCGRKIKFKKVMEIDHIFDLGTTYSRPLGATYLNEKGREVPMVMGCYGIGVSRLVAAVVEQHHDKDGITFPVSVAPFVVLLVLLNPKHAPSAKAAEGIYQELLASGLDVLLDERDERPGFKFKDGDLVGIPIQVVVGERSISQGKVEVVSRRSRKRKLLFLKEAVPFIQKILDSIGNYNNSSYAIKKED